MEEVETSSLNVVNSFSDLYLLRKEQLLPLERIADKSADNLMLGIQDSKKVPFERVLFSLGIRFVGETVARKLATYYTDIDKIMNTSFEELIQVDEIGDKSFQGLNENESSSGLTKCC